AAILRIRDPEGHPATGAKVALAWLDQGQTPPPEELSDRLAARSGPDGRAILNSIPLDLIRQVRVTTESFGIQGFSAHNGFKAEEGLRLRPTVSVEGRVTADDPAVVRGLLIHLR